MRVLRACLHVTQFGPAQIQSIRQELQGLKHLGHRNLARYMDLTYDVDQDNITVQVGGWVWQGVCQCYDVQVGGCGRGRVSVMMCRWVGVAGAEGVLVL